MNDQSNVYAPPKAAVADITETEPWNDRGRMPLTVRIAVVLLWTAVPLYGLGIVLSWTHSPYSKFTSPIGLAFWVTVNYFIVKRSRAARIALLACTFLIVPLLAVEDYLYYIGRPVAHSPFYIPRLMTIWGCRAAAAYLLFTREASAWYGRRHP